MFRLNNIDNKKELVEYPTNLEDYCPYIAPSKKNKSLFFSTYNIKSSLGSFNHTFFICLIHVEIFRKKRLTSPSKKEKILLCENVIFNYAKSVNNKEIFDWVHWIFKILYTDLGIAFGKFWKGEHKKSLKFDTYIPSPPYNLFSIRSSIKPIDKKFYKIPQLENIYLSSNDNSEDVFSKIFKDKETLEIIKEIATITHLPNLSQEDVNMLINKLKNTNLINKIVCYTENYSYEMFHENEAKKEIFRKLYHQFRVKYL